VWVASREQQPAGTLAARRFGPVVGAV
jgi:hypothetical protein